jgi:hypothetical protein
MLDVGRNSGAKRTKPRKTPKSAAVYDWREERLTEKQKQFVFYFTWPGQDGFHCAAKAADKAGYSKTTAHTHACKMLRDPKIKKLIQKFESEARESVHDAAQRFIQEKITRADYSVRDFFDVTEGVNKKTGRPWRLFLPKNPESLTSEQLLCVENIVTSRGAGNIVFADRQKERDAVIALDRAWNGESGRAGQDLEEIREVIIERVTMRREKRINRADADDFEIKDAPEDAGSEEI